MLALAHHEQVERHASRIAVRFDEPTNVAYVSGAETRAASLAVNRVEQGS